MLREKLKICSLSKYRLSEVIHKLPAKSPIGGEFRVINLHSIGNHILRADRNKLRLRCTRWDSESCCSNKS